MWGGGMTTTTLQAGRELDALVAEKVMGWQITTPIDNSCDHSVGRRRDGTSARRNWGVPPHKADEKEEWKREDVIPNYSTSIAAAWEVITRLWERRNEFHLSFVDGFKVDYDGREWTAGFWEVDYDAGDSWFKEATANTAPLAICLAALKAVE